MSLTTSVISYERAELEWNGDQVMADVLAAAAVAIDYTMTKCVLRARQFHDYEDHTMHMTESIQILDLATANPVTDHVSGAWGATADYSLYLEIGTSRPWSGAPKAEMRAEMGNGNMWAIPPPLPAGRHTDTRFVGHYLPGSIETSEGRYVLPGQGPLMEPRMSMRPAAAEEYPLLAARIGMAFRGEALA